MADAPTKSRPLLSLISESFQVRVYGTPIADMQLPAGDDPQQQMPRVGNRLALIRAFRFLSGTERCVRLPVPVLFSVDDDGKTLEQDECGFKAGDDTVLYWDILQTSDRLSFFPEAGDAISLLESLATRGVSGGIECRNCGFSGGKLCCDVHIWAKISAIGQSVSFDENRRVCIHVAQPCYTVWNNGWARLDVCYQAPNTICLKLCVGKWGIEKCWEHCETISLSATDVQTACECAATT